MPESDNDKLGIYSLYLLDTNKTHGGKYTVELEINGNVRWSWMLLQITPLPVKVSTWKNLQTGLRVLNSNIENIYR